jgi:hypothetical protein
MKPVHRRAAHPAHRRRRSLYPSEVGNGGNQQRQEERGGGGGGYKDGGFWWQRRAEVFDFPREPASAIPPRPKLPTRARARPGSGKTKPTSISRETGERGFFARRRPDWERGLGYQTRAFAAHEPGRGFLHHIKRALKILLGTVILYIYEKPTISL